MSCILPSAVDCCEVAFCDAPVVTLVPGPTGPPGATGADGTNVDGFFIVDTLTLARAVLVDPTNKFMVMLGTAAKGNGFGAQFYWDNASVALDDYINTGGSVINPAGNAGAGRWLRFI